MEKSDMIYGTRAVIEAIHAGKQIERILIQKGVSNELVRELTTLARNNHIPFVSVPPEKLKRLSTKNHQGVICFLSAVQYASLDNLIRSCFEKGTDPFLLLLDRITDVRNLGAIVRTCECAGLDGVVVPEKGSAPLTSDAVKTSAGALHHMPICRERDLSRTIQFLQESGVKVVVCTEKASHDLFQVELVGPVALVMGSEEDGVSDAIIKQADELVRIPMQGNIGSLNVSVAAGVAIYEVVRQRQASAR